MFRYVFHLPLLSMHVLVCVVGEKYLASLLLIFLPSQLLHAQIYALCFISQMFGERLATTLSSEWHTNTDPCIWCCFVHTDVEAGVAELVWPMSNPIVATAASQCSTLLAVALANNDVVIWNRELGK